MARMIDADKLFPYGAVPYVPGDGFETADKIYGIIKNAPTVDAVPVVRCKDCIHWHEPEGVCLKIYSDGAVSEYAWQDRNADDFCSYGERRTNEPSYK